MTTDQHLSATYAYVGALVDALALSGVRHACLCPGSRSTPLALSLAAHPAIKLWMHVDERSCAFFALGLAKASGTPVAIACTSGTAAANFYPAMVEARYGRVPLVALTADRPPELRENGAPQAIDQLNLYGRHTKWFMEMALPEDGELMLRYARATAARAVATATEAPAGPVHLNLPFREPFVPATVTFPANNGGAFDNAYAALGVIGGPRRTYGGDMRDIAGNLVADFMDELHGRHGLIVCGPQTSPDLGAAVTRLAAMLGYPVLADPLSGVRCGPERNAYVCDAYDAFLRILPEDRLIDLTPDVVLRFGAIPTSKPLQTFLNRARHEILVDGDNGWQDPSARADTLVHADPTLFCEDVIAELERHFVDARALTYTRNQSWVELWRDADRHARAAIEVCLNRQEGLFEGRVFAELATLLPARATLYAGNSMPVRDLDTFFPGSSRDIRFLCNRGANGIDGIVSSALGAAAHLASGGEGQGPLVLVIGDLSFYHDMNGLLAAKQHKLDATIILLNNDGGGIFSFLPQAAGVEDFERLFGTPTGLDFAPVARMYGCGFETVTTWPAFRRAVSASLDTPGVRIVELRTDRGRNVILHREVWQAVKEAL